MYMPVGGQIILLLLPRSEEYFIKKNPLTAGSESGLRLGDTNEDVPRFLLQTGCRERIVGQSYCLQPTHLRVLAVAVRISC